MAKESGQNIVMAKGLWLRSYGRSYVAKESGQNVWRATNTPTTFFIIKSEHAARSRDGTVANTSRSTSSCGDERAPMKTKKKVAKGATESRMLRRHQHAAAYRPDLRGFELWCRTSWCADDWCRDILIGDYNTN